jgi:anti-anti-sigma factor
MLLDISPTDEGFKLEGELDLATAEDLGAVLGKARSDGPLVLDFSGVSFMDSSGLRALLEAVRSRDGDGPLVILNPTPPVQRVFDITLPDGVPGLEVRA